MRVALFLLVFAGASCAPTVPTRTATLREDLERIRMAREACVSYCASDTTCEECDTLARQLVLAALDGTILR